MKTAVRTRLGVPIVIPNLVVNGSRPFRRGRIRLTEISESQDALKPRLAYVRMHRNMYSQWPRLESSWLCSLRTFSDIEIIRQRLCTYGFWLDMQNSNGRWIESMPTVEWSIAHDGHSLDHWRWWANWSASDTIELVIKPKRLSFHEHQHSCSIDFMSIGKSDWNDPEYTDHIDASSAAGFPHWSTR